MSEERELILPLLRAIRADIGDIKESIKEAQLRLYALELNYVALRPQVDRIAGDMERVKTRLELTEVTP